jgi:hypothetical protein
MAFDRRTLLKILLLGLAWPKKVFARHGGGADPWATLDGRSGATKQISAQYPNLLNGYPISSPPNVRVRWPQSGGTQPPWQVAGVDYPVGMNPNCTINIGTSTFTYTDINGSPTAHGYAANDRISFYTTGTLPTGILPGGNNIPGPIQQYFVSATNLTSTTFQVSASSGGAVITLSGTQTGFHNALKDPNNVFPGGGPNGNLSVSSVNQLWTVAGATNTTLDAYDFSVNGPSGGVPYALQITNTQTTVVQNSKICPCQTLAVANKNGGMIGVGTVAGPVTIQYCFLDGSPGIASLNVPGAFGANLLGSGLSLVQYNYVKNQQGTPFSWGGGGVTGNLVYQYNLLDHPTGIQPPSHSNIGQGSGTAFTLGILIQYNTIIYETMQGFAGQMIQVYGQTGSIAQINNPTVQNNVMISSSTVAAAVARVNSNPYSLGNNITVASSIAPFYVCAVAGTAASSPPGTYTSTPTITNGSPATINWTAHGYVAGQQFWMYWNNTPPADNTNGGTLGNGPGQGGSGTSPVVYYVLATGLTANAFQFSIAPGGTAISTTAGAGTLGMVAPVIDGGAQFMPMIGTQDVNSSANKACISSFMEGPTLGGHNTPLTGSRLVSQNYTDTRGSTGYVAGVNNGNSTFYNPGSFNNFAFIGNVNMIDGSTMT